MRINAQMSSSGNFTEEITVIAKELINLTHYEGPEAIKEEINSSGFYSTIQIILTACRAYRDFLQQNVLPNPRASKSDVNTKVIKYGTTLIFQLRKFITGESLYFVLAGTTKNQALREKTYSQEEIFSQENLNTNFRVSFSNAQIELAGCIEKLSALDLAEESLASQWKKVLEYGFTSDYKKEEPIGDGQDNAYHKASPDINVYMKFSNTGRRKTLTYYYMTHGQIPKSREDLIHGKSYDRGWMYQWLKMNQGVEINDSSFTPLLPLMTADSSVRENIAGIKSGDYGLEQYKYRNRRVITFNNMIDILTGEKRNYLGIIPSLELLLNTQNAPAEAFSHLIADFTTLNEVEIRSFVDKRLIELGLDR